MIKEMSADKTKLIPDKGYNVVGIDDYEIPGEQLYLIGHFDDEKSAKTAKVKFQKENPGETAHIYNPETK